MPANFKNPLLQSASRCQSRPRERPREKARTSQEVPPLRKLLNRSKPPRMARPRERAKGRKPHRKGEAVGNHDLFTLVLVHQDWKGQQLQRLDHQAQHRLWRTRMGTTNQSSSSAMCPPATYAITASARTASFARRPGTQLQSPRSTIPLSIRRMWLSGASQSSWRRVPRLHRPHHPKP